VASRGATWRRQELATGALAGRLGEWVNNAFGCQEWVAPEGALGWGTWAACDGFGGQIGHCDLSSLRITRRATPSAQPADERIFLWLLDKGRVSFEGPDGAPLDFGPGCCLVSDGTRPLQAHWENAGLFHLSLSRQRGQELLGRDLSASLQRIVPLRSPGLLGLLNTQLHLLKTQGVAWSLAELDETLSVIVSTAESLLRLAFPRSSAHGAPAGTERVRAVYRYIERNMHRHDLSVDQIALGVNSSRAQLYRLFQTEPLTLRATLRETRLLRSREYLRHGEDRLPSIGAIAHACGFWDQSTFCKLFRQRFGVTPSEVRDPHARRRVREMAAPGPDRPHLLPSSH
jgi:AraC-like DNA-binding protein